MEDKPSRRPKTFRRWLEKADSRIKYLTEVQELATLHDRELHPTEDATTPMTPGAYKLLADRLSDVEQELQDSRELVGRLAQRLHELETQRVQSAHPGKTPLAAGTGELV